MTMSVKLLCVGFLSLVAPSRQIVDPTPLFRNDGTSYRINSMRPAVTHKLNNPDVERRILETFNHSIITFQETGHGCSENVMANGTHAGFSADWDNCNQLNSENHFGGMLAASYVYKDMPGIRVPESAEMFMGYFSTRKRVCNFDGGAFGLRDRWPGPRYNHLGTADNGAILISVHRKPDPAVMPIPPQFLPPCRLVASEERDGVRLKEVCSSIESAVALLFYLTILDCGDGHINNILFDRNGFLTVLDADNCLNTKVEPHNFFDDPRSFAKRFVYEPSITTSPQNNRRWRDSFRPEWREKVLPYSEKLPQNFNDWLHKTDWDARFRALEFYDELDVATIDAARLRTRILIDGYDEGLSVLQGYDYLNPRMERMVMQTLQNLQEAMKNHEFFGPRLTCYTTKVKSRLNAGSMVPHDYLAMSGLGKPLGKVRQIKRETQAECDAILSKQREDTLRKLFFQELDRLLSYPSILGFAHPVKLTLE